MKSGESGCVQVEDPVFGAPPHEQLEAIKLDVLGCQELLEFSVFERDERHVARVKSLCDPRLGLPSGERKCLTCGADDTRTCVGHFGHIRLPEPIYHPLYIKTLLKVLRTLCFRCRTLKKSKLKEAQQPVILPLPLLQAAPRSRGRSRTRTRTASRNCVVPYEHSSAGVLERELLQLQGKAGVGRRRLSGQKRKPRAAGANNGVVARKQVRRNVGRRRRVVEDDDDDAAEVEVEEYDSWEAEAEEEEEERRSGGGGGQEHSREVVQGGGGGHCDACPLCATGKRLEGYPPLRLKLVSSQTRSGATVDSIEMEAGTNYREVPADDYWDFLDGGHPGGQTADDPNTTRTLLASEALHILKDLPEPVMAELCRKNQVVNPEAFIITCVPVPPNSSRQVTRFGSGDLMPLEQDPATKVLAQLLRTVRDIRENTEDKKFGRRKEDARRLQQNYSLCLKASKMKEEPEKQQDKEGLIEPKGRGLSGKVWMKNNVFGKYSDFCFRGAVTGDPGLSIQEIGLNYDIAKVVTVPEVVTKFNKERLQAYVNNRNKTTGSASRRTTLATFVTRLGDRFDLQGSLAGWELELGEKVERHLMDGDYVIANRQPSVHKHSLIALRVVLHPSNAIGLNPLICPPFGADFDGDCFSVYAPQSVQSIVECRELMTVEQQLINPQAGQSIVSLTQDTLLGAYLLTCGHVFFTRHVMGNLAALGPGQVAVPAIVKSPRGAFWTGKQAFSMTLPHTLQYSAAEFGVHIRHGELLHSHSDSRWLSGSAKGLVRAIHWQAGPDSALTHLNFIQSMAIWWLSHRGFSVGLSDFLVAREENRDHMLAQIKGQLLRANKAAEKEQILTDPYIQRVAIDSRNVTAHSSYADRSRMKVEALQRLGVAKFQDGFTRIDHLIMGHVQPGNSVLAMVKAGSKGSMGKLVQQGGCFGLQLYKGEEVLPLWYGKPFTTEEQGSATTLNAVSLAGHWDSRGLIWRSLVDGLRPKEFFVQTMCSRSSAPSYGLALPNKIFRNLNLHMRDIYAAHDGTVRHRLGGQLIQLSYGGCRGPDDALPSAEEGAALKISPTPVCAGEAIGALAATALAEPAYNFVLSSSQQAGKVDPVNLLQDTFFSRKKAPMKELDRTVTLRLAQAVRNRVTGQERAALEIQEYLKTVSLSLLTTRHTIEYRAREKKGVDGPHRTTPWLGHLQLDGNDMQMCGLTLDVIVQKVLEKLGDDKKLKAYNISVIPLTRCDQRFPYTGPLDSASPCLHIFHDLNVSHFHDDELSEDQARQNWEVLRDEVMPAIMETIVVGDERIQSVKIRWEDKYDWSRRPPSQNDGSDDANPFDFGNELVLDVVVKSSYMEGSTCRKSSRGKPWGLVIQACMRLAHLVDWKRSMPASIQEVCHIFGIDAARNCILQRLTLATRIMGLTMDSRLLKLTADTMVQTGHVVGMSAAGYQEFLNCYELTAPFTQATDQEPLRKFAQASAKGDVENLSSVVTSAVWGKHVQLGTGADMEVLWKDDKVRQMKRSQFNMDVHEFMSYFVDLPVYEVTTPKSPSVYHSMSSDDIRGRDNVESELDDEGNSTLSEPGTSSSEISILSPLPSTPTEHTSADTPYNSAHGPSSIHQIHSSEVCPQTSADFLVDSVHQGLPLRRDVLEDHANNIVSPPSRKSSPSPDGCLQPGSSMLKKPLFLSVSDVSKPVASKCDRSTPEQISGSSSLQRPASKLATIVRNMFVPWPRSTGEGINQDGAPNWLAEVETCIRQVLHCGYYKVGDKLSGLHQSQIMMELVPFHPNYEEKVRGGVKFLSYGLHQHHRSPCVFVVRNDGTSVDVSLRKCVEGRIQKQNLNYMTIYKQKLKRGPNTG